MRRYGDTFVVDEDVDRKFEINDCIKDRMLKQLEKVIEENKKTID